MTAHRDVVSCAANVADAMSVDGRGGDVTAISADPLVAGAGSVRGSRHGAQALMTRIRHTWRWLVHAGQMLVGMPDYEVYLAHLRQHHPEREPMTREVFFRSRQEARYRGGAGRCC